ncbi:GH20820 [Drosophila grimshawi]|uniref:GH20820 n=2 Tax=Drosophila grimshawi TaxID=7222 RepID=B4J5V7_DROGR|nr:GH20820 [Drosophila grimshawi]
MLDLERQKREKLTEPPCCVQRASSCTPCAHAWPKRNAKEKELDSLIKPFRSMWAHSSIPHNHPSCPDLYPRFDAMFYTPSNKSRSLQRTWVECPKVQERLKKVCCPDKIIPPEVQRRVKKRCPQAACAFDYVRMRKLCAHKSNDKCRKLFWPCCKPERCELGCRIHRAPSACKRLRAPCPCFSERRPSHRVRRQKECREILNFCQMFALHNRREMFNIKSSYC